MKRTFRARCGVALGFEVIAVPGVLTMQSDGKDS